MKIINGTVYLAPGETFGAGKKLKKFDSTGYNFLPKGRWSKKSDQLRNQGKVKSR